MSLLSNSLIHRCDFGLRPPPCQRRRFYTLNFQHFNCYSSLKFSFSIWISCAIAVENLIHNDFYSQTRSQSCQPREICRHPRISIWVWPQIDFGKGACGLICYDYSTFQLLPYWPSPPYQSTQEARSPVDLHWNSHYSNHPEPYTCSQSTWKTSSSPEHTWVCNPFQFLAWIFRVLLRKRLLQVCLD